MQDHNPPDQGLTQANGALAVVDPQPPATPSPDLIGDLLGTLAIEGPPGTPPQPEKDLSSGLDSAPTADEALAITPVEEQANTVQVSFLGCMCNRIFCCVFLLPDTCNHLVVSPLHISV